MAKNLLFLLLFLVQLLSFQQAGLPFSWGELQEEVMNALDSPGDNMGMASSRSSFLDFGQHVSQADAFLIFGYIPVFETDIHTRSSDDIQTPPPNSARTMMV